MTCIAGYTKGKHTWMGGDAAAVDGYHAVDIYSKAKVFKLFSDDGKTTWLFGFAGCFRIGQIVKYNLHPPSLLKHPEKDIEEIFACALIDTLRHCLKKAGVLKENDGVVSMASDTSFLIGVNGRLATIDQDFQVIPLEKPYAAIGIGGNYATGALGIMDEFDATTDPVRRLTLALHIAHAHNAGIQKPFTIISTEPKNKPRVIT